jgi:TPR repeat protein
MVWIRDVLEFGDISQHNGGEAVKVPAKLLSVLLVLSTMGAFANAWSKNQARVRYETAISMLKNGHSEKARIALSSEAKRGNDFAIAALSSYLRSGDFGEADDFAAAFWLKLSNEKGVYEFAYALDHFEIVSQRHSPERGTFWILRAAEQRAVEAVDWLTTKSNLEKTTLTGKMRSPTYWVNFKKHLN